MKIIEAQNADSNCAVACWDLSPLAAASKRFPADRFGLVRTEMFRFDMRSSASAAGSEKFALGTWRKVQWHRG